MNLVYLLMLSMWGLEPHGSDLHDFHLSKSEVYYNTVNQSLEVSLHLFIDDLEVAMQNAGIDQTHIATSKEIENADSLISQYLNDHFCITVDGKQIQFNFLGKEDSDDLLAIWCYLEGEQITNPREIQINNKLLVEVFDDQKNIVAFSSEKKQEFLLFDIKKQVATIAL